MNQFSIILPVRNGGEYVKECVNSILAQTYQNFNLIVLDNNSSDGTKEWIESLNNNRITIYPSTKDLTITENWARAVDVPKNEFMTLIGHDDILYPNYLQVINDLINEYPNASLYQTHFNYIDANGSIVRECKPMTTKQSAAEFLQCQFLATLDSMGTGYMFRSKDYALLKGMPINYPNLIFADYELWVRLIMLNFKATAQKKCFGYRLHNSTSKTTNGEQYQQAFLMYIQFLISLRNNETIKKVIDRYGKYFLMYFCESLSHRILKTFRENRKITVHQFVKKCIEHSRDFIPNKNFNPYYRIKILAAIVLDNSIGRRIFAIIKKTNS